MKTFGIILVILSIGTCFVLFIGYEFGSDSGARQMARHILHPQYRTDSFDRLVSEETGVNLEDRWGDGYEDCMESVIKALMTCDEVRIGNLIVNEPYTYVSDIVFFALDPNMAIEINGSDSTITGCTFSYTVSDDFKDRFELNTVDNTLDEAINLSGTTNEEINMNATKAFVETNEVEVVVTGADVIIEKLRFFEPTEPKEPGKPYFIIQNSTSDIGSVSFSPMDSNVIICDSTLEKFLEILPFHIYWTMNAKAPSGIVTIQWAEPNEVEFNPAIRSWNNFTEALDERITAIEEIRL